MRCAVYVRVSTEEQAKEGYSLAAQTDKIVEYIKSICAIAKPSFFKGSIAQKCQSSFEL